ncbi:MAG: hypothetical protein GY755_03370 [Chloroflexi bacterium]|nr:hypothetical protein [Chloroflexota bacterium]
MAKAEIFAGNCGYTTKVDAKMDGAMCKLDIDTECPHITKMAKEIPEVDPYKQISFKRAMPTIHEAGHKYCTHACCPVPVGIIKAVEIEAQLALPTDVTIKLSKE